MKTIELHKTDGTLAATVEVRQLGGQWSDCYEVYLEGKCVTLCPFKLPVDVRRVAKKVQETMNTELKEAMGPGPDLFDSLVVDEDTGEIISDKIANPDLQSPDFNDLKAECDNVLRYMSDVAARRAALKLKRDGYVSRFDKMIAGVDRVTSYLEWKYANLMTSLCESVGRGKTHQVTLDHGELKLHTATVGRWEVEGDEEEVAKMLVQAGMKNAVKVKLSVAKSGLTSADAERVSQVTNGRLKYVEPETKLKIKVTGTDNQQDEQ